MRIRSKLVALIAVPLIALAFIALVGFRGQSIAIEKAEDASEAVDVNTLIDMAVLAIGDERLLLSGADVGRLSTVQEETDRALFALETADVPEAVIEATVTAKESVTAIRSDGDQSVELLSEANAELLAAAVGRTEDFPNASSYTGAWLNHTAILALEAREAAWIEYLDAETIGADDMSGSTADRFGRSSALASQVADLVVATETESFNEVYRSDTLRDLDSLQARALDDIREGRRTLDPPQILTGLVDFRSDWVEAVQTQGGTVRSLVDAELDAANSARSLATLMLLLGGLVLAALLFVVYRSVTSPLEQLTTRAAIVANEELPQLVDQLRYGSDVEDLPEARPIPVDSSDEIGELVTAFNQLQLTSYNLAAEQAVGRRNVADMFVNLGRRNQQLLHRILNQLTRLEQKEEDPDTLRELFELDSAVTRMRRNAESLVALAGGQTPRQWTKPVEIDNAVRGAFGEVENYERIEITSLTPAKIQGNVVADLTHLVAEILENAINFSEPDTQVLVSGRRDGANYLITVIDEGIGMSPEELAENNTRIADPPPLERVPTRFLGLYVVGRLAERHGIGVRLSEAPHRGVMARIEVPAELLAGETESAPAPIEIETGEEPLARRAGGQQESSPLEADHDIDAELASMLDDTSEPPTSGGLPTRSRGRSDKSAEEPTGQDDRSSATIDDEPKAQQPATPTSGGEGGDGLPTRGGEKAGASTSSVPEADADTAAALPTRGGRASDASDDEGGDALPSRSRRKEDKPRAGRKSRSAGAPPRRDSLKKRAATDNSEKSAGDFSSMMSALSSGVTRGMAENDRKPNSRTSGEDTQEGSEG